MVNQFGLTLPIEKAQLPGKNGNPVPVLSLRSWFSFLLKQNHWHILCGLYRPDWIREEAILQAFWDHYRAHYPQHDIFEKERRGEVVLRRCAPLLCHGDEGRGRRHSAFLVVSCASVLGRGLQEHARKGKREYLRMLPNYKGHSYTSRFLTAALPKTSYTNSNAEVFDQLMSFASDEFYHLVTEGVQHENRGQFWGCLLQVTGDWPWLVKSGNLTRSFWNAEKHKETAGKKRKTPGGVCHLCCAGQPKYDFEEIGSRSPKWRETLHAESPFRVEPPLLKLPHVFGQGAGLWFFDLFHTWHIGCGKAFLASFLVLLAEQRPEGNIDSRMDALGQDYISFCKGRGKRPFMTRLNKEALNYPTSNCFPNGSWHKGELTTMLMQYVEHRFSTEDWSDFPVSLRLCGEAATAVNASMRVLYSGTAWLSVPEAREAAEQGLRFLRRYSNLCKISHAAGRTLFVLQPKFHAYHHLMMYLLDGTSRGAAVLNPLCFSTQISEDFVGRPSRLSRRVTSQRPCADRVIDRYLRSCYHQWVKCGFIVCAN